MRNFAFMSYFSCSLLINLVLFLALIGDGLWTHGNHFFVMIGLGIYRLRNISFIVYCWRITRRISLLFSRCYDLDQLLMLWSYPQRQRLFNNLNYYDIQFTNEHFCGYTVSIISCTSSTDLAISALLCGVACSKSTSIQLVDEYFLVSCMLKTIFKW